MGRDRRTTRRLSAVIAVCSLGVALALAQGSPALADGVGSPQPGSYTVKVSLTGNGVGSGNAYPGVPGSPGGAVSVPSLCVRDTDPSESMAAWRNVWHTTAPTDTMTDDQIKKYLIKTYVEGSDANAPVGSTGWEAKLSYQMMVDHWNDEGNIYSSYCTGTQSDAYFTRFTTNNPPIFLPPGAPLPPMFEPPVRVPDLLRAAENAMTLPTVRSVGINPVGRTYVQLPTYVWANESAPVGVGTTRTVRASVEAAGRAQFAQVTATYGRTTFTANGSTSCSTGDAGAASRYSRGAPASCLVFTVSSSATRVTADSHWTAVSRVCTISPAGAYNCVTPAVPDSDMIGASNVAVAEIQTLDR